MNEKKYHFITMVLVIVVFLVIVGVGFLAYYIYNLESRTIANNPEPMNEIVEQNMAVMNNTQIGNIDGNNQIEVTNEIISNPFDNGEKRRC
jgi:hypothetical protein